MTHAAAFALMLDATHEALEQPSWATLVCEAADRGELCECSHGAPSHARGVVRAVPGKCFAADCACEEYAPPSVRKPVPPSLVASPPSLDAQVATVIGVIEQRRLPCYGALQITDAQIEEMSRAIVNTLNLENHVRGIR